MAQVYVINVKYLLRSKQLKSLCYHRLCVSNAHTMLSPFPPDLTMVVLVVSSSFSYLVRSSTPTMAYSSTPPMTPILFKSAPPLRSFIITWSGLDLLAGSLVWLLLKASCWMCSLQGLSTSHCSVSESIIHLYLLCIPLHDHGGILII